jgi:hypothetical protein
MLEKVVQDIIRTVNIYPKLNYIRISKGIYQISGEIDIFDKNGIYWDSFQIRIITPSNYPYSFPTVYLVGNRIPIEADRHINKDRSCCLTIQHEEILRAEKGITIKQFFDDYVIPFFANQLYFEKHKQWANGDYLHSENGIIQYYKEQTNIETIEDILSLLNNITQIKKLGRNDMCYCGSNLKFKRCHLQTLQKILRLPIDRINNDKLIIEKLILNSP